LAKLLVVEDDATLCDVIGELLTRDHHMPEIVSSGDEALLRLKTYSYDLVVLDWELPGLSGVEIMSEFRGRGGTTPILFLTGRRTLPDKEVVFNAGADDYLTKPFQGKELTLRVNALLRRSQGNASVSLKVGSMELDRGAFRVMRGTEEIRLLPKEFALLEFLMRHPDTVFDPESLLNRVWETESDATVEALTSCIKRLRKKLDEEGRPSIIRNVHGVGYGFNKSSV
jgi:DNA-binding response OmpR family regulator